MSTYYIMRIPLPLPKPRHVISHCVRIDHDGFDPGPSALTKALRELVDWGNDHRDNQHTGLPAEWATRSYFKYPVTFEGAVTNDDVLKQLEASGARVRVVTCEAAHEFPWAQMMRTLFSESGVLEVYSTFPPQREPNEEDSILDA